MLNPRIDATLALALVLLTSAACLPVEHDRRSQVFDQAPEQLVLELEAGSVLLRASDEPRVLLRTDARYTRVAPEVRTSLVDGVLRVEADCELQAVCDVEVELTLPASTELDLRIAHGSLEARGFTAPLRADLSDGSVDLFDLEGPIDVAVSNGSITGLGLSSPSATLDGCSGSIELELRQPADVWAEVCTGSIDLQVPSGDYRLELAASLGSVSAFGVSDDPAASRILHAHTSVGSVDIRGR